MANKKIVWFINHISDRIPFPNGEVAEIFDGYNTWWLSTNPIALIDALIGKQEPMYYMIKQPDGSMELRERSE